LEFAIDIFGRYDFVRQLIAWQNYANVWQNLVNVWQNFANHRLKIFPRELTIYIFLPGICDILDISR